MANFQYLPGYPVKTETDTSVPPPPLAEEYCETEDAVVKKDADTSFNPVLLDPDIAREQKVKLLEARIKRLGVVDENRRHQLAEKEKRVGILTLRRETDKLEIETRKRN
jgi:CBS domain-containing protein